MQELGSGDEEEGWKRFPHPVPPALLQVWAAPFPREPGALTPLASPEHLRASCFHDPVEPRGSGQAVGTNAGRQEATRRAGSYSHMPNFPPPAPPILLPSQTSGLGSGLPANPQGLREPHAPSQGGTESRKQTG